MSRIKAAYKLAESHANELGYKGVIDAMLNGTPEHKAAIRKVNKDYLVSTKPTNFRKRLVYAK